MLGLEPLLRPAVVGYGFCGPLSRSIAPAEVAHSWGGAAGRGSVQASQLDGMGQTGLMERTDLVPACTWPAGWEESSIKEQVACQHIHPLERAAPSLSLLSLC